MFCRLGSREESRPVTAPVWSNEACSRPVRRHTIFGSNRVYTDTTGGVPTVVDWINAMRADDKTNWVNVEASPFNVVQPGDPLPPTDPNGHRLPPFDNTGPETLVICP